ncbi:MAG: decarboxylating NADP(+)-dependent phosphogluconate dehydrogenase, partial [Chitinispirillales bacterium]|nr:decarboxylating NADP(+)-dependent phosphogluconate dehydrogenase [Chitinispirillales bacterium]
MSKLESKNQSACKCDIGVAGLAVMGRNLALNINDSGYSVAVYNREVPEVSGFLSGAASGRGTVIGACSVEEFCSRLKSPRKILLMVKAGEAVDWFIDEMLPFLAPGDCVIDGGNSFFKDTIRRYNYLESKGIIFCGAGISGGEEGARRGPSIMPGGDPRAWPLVKDIFQSVCAKTPSGDPCCDWIGGGGAGHYVKMVHNGIEYGDMQLISEAYSLLKNVLELSHDEMAELFYQWNEAELNSYLIGITADILKYKDVDGGLLVEKILDCAGQKGTGKWMSANALELGVPVTLITEAVYARDVSAMVDERAIASSILKDDHSSSSYIRGAVANMFTPKDVKKALLASKIISYAQGFMLLSSASKMYGWDLDLGNIARLWCGGCIIRSVFLDDIRAAYHKDPSLQNLLVDGKFSGLISECLQAWRSVVSAAI